MPQALVSRLARASRILPAVTGLRHVSKEGSLAHRARSLTVSTSWASSSSSSRPMWFRLISADASNQFRKSPRNPHRLPSTQTLIGSRETPKKFTKRFSPNLAVARAAPTWEHCTPRSQQPWVGSGTVGGSWRGGAQASELRELRAVLHSTGKRVRTTEEVRVVCGVQHTSGTTIRVLTLSPDCGGVRSIALPTAKLKFCTLATRRRAVPRRPRANGR